MDSDGCRRVSSAHGPVHSDTGNLKQRERVMTPGVQFEATVLLTVSFGKFDTARSRSLSPKELGRFAPWLKTHGLQPGTLLKGRLKDLLSGWEDQSMSLSRLESLPAHGGALGLAFEKWQRAGLWVMIRSDPEYPGWLKRQL